MLKFFCFFVSSKLAAKLARAAGSLEGCTVIEVGAGPGGLTRSILELGAKQVIAIEKDDRFIENLKAMQLSFPQLHVVHADVLGVKEDELLEQCGAESRSWESPAAVKVIGNLPFNVGTPLLIKWLRSIQNRFARLFGYCFVFVEISCRSGLFKFGRVPMTLTYQLEVGQRIVASHSCPEYSRLSVMIQAQCSARHCFTIPRKSFVPEPKVDAAVVLIEPSVTRSYSALLRFFVCVWVFLAEFSFCSARIR